jgi:hypothetical protein
VLSVKGGVEDAELDSELFVIKPHSAASFGHGAARANRESDAEYEEEHDAAEKEDWPR